MKETVYCLRLVKTRQILTLETLRDSCYALSVDETNPVWTQNLKESAEWVRRNPTRHFESLYDTPAHNYKPEELEVIERETVTKDKPITVKLPSFEEFVRWRYLTEGSLLYDKRHGELMFERIAENKYNYNQYQLSCWAKEHKQ